MKRFKLVLVAFTVCLLWSCDTDRDDISLSQAEVDQMNLLVKQGDWKIARFEENGMDKTANFSDYSFAFEDPNNITAVAKTGDMQGTWRINNDNGSEFDSYNDVDFNLYFTPDHQLGDLTNAYDVISANNVEIKLSLEGNADGNTGFLTFSKN